jgi:hypothetical protein
MISQNPDSSWDDPRCDQVCHRHNEGDRDVPDLGWTNLR